MVVMFTFTHMKMNVKVFGFLFLMVSLWSCNELQKVSNVVNENIEKYGGTLSTTDIISGLKAALDKGTGTSISSLSANGGFAKSVYRLAIPQEAQNVSAKLRQYGMGKLVDDFEAKLNSAAESAVPAAKTIFVNAIKSMTIEDARGILQGGSGAATSFFERKTRQSLYTAFYPKVASVLDNSGTTKYWTDIVSNYNKLPGTNNLNEDLKDYTSKKILDALFDSIRKEENNIRQNPAARTSEILKKVFGSQN